MYFFLLLCIYVDAGMHERFMTEITIDAYAPFTYCILWESESGPINLRVAWINWTMCSSYTGSVSIQFKLHFSSKIKQSFGSDTWHVTFTFIYVVSSCISMCTQAAHAICIYIRLECLSDIGSDRNIVIGKRTHSIFIASPVPIIEIQQNSEWKLLTTDGSCLHSRRTSSSREWMV